MKDKKRDDTPKLMETKPDENCPACSGVGCLCCSLTGKKEDYEMFKAILSILPPLYDKPQDGDGGGK